MYIIVNKCTGFEQTFKGFNLEMLSATFEVFIRISVRNGVPYTTILSWFINSVHHIGKTFMVNVPLQSYLMVK